MVRLCRRTGSLRPTSGPSYMGKRPRNTAGGGEKHKRKPPRGMYINHDDIVTLASNPNTESDRLLSSMDREVVALMSQVRPLDECVDGAVVGGWIEERRGTGERGRDNLG